MHRHNISFGGLGATWGYTLSECSKELPKINSLLLSKAGLFTMWRERLKKCRNQESMCFEFAA
jgi:hypothetical protein